MKTRLTLVMLLLPALMQVVHGQEQQLARIGDLRLDSGKIIRGPDFPEFSIRDMVSAEQQLVVETLQLRHLRAVMGFSMGGMQAFQWAVSYPGFVDKVISIVGSPQLTAYDLLLWRTTLLALESDPNWKEGRYTSQPDLHLMNMIQMLALLTPQYVVSNNPRREFQKFESGLVQGPDDLDANDTLRQIQALLSADVAAPFDGSLQRAAATVRSQMLVVVNKQDHLVNPQPGGVGPGLIRTRPTCGASVQ